MVSDERSEKEEDLLEHGVELGLEPLQLGRIHGLDYLRRRGRRGRGADAVLHARWLRGRAGDGGVHGQGAEFLQQLLRRAQEPGAAQVPRALLLRLWPRPRRLVLLRLRYAAAAAEMVVVQRQRRGVGAPVVVERQRQRRLESLPEVVVAEVPADDGRGDVETERGLAAVRRHHRGRRHVAPGPVHLHPGLLVVRLQAVEVKTLLPAADVHLRHERRHGAGRRREVVRVRETWLIMRHVSMCSCGRDDRGGRGGSGTTTYV